MMPQNPIGQSDLGMTIKGVVQDAPIQESDIANKRSQKLAEKSAEKIDKILGGEQTPQLAKPILEKEALAISIHQIPAAVVVMPNETNVDSVADKTSINKESQSMVQSVNAEANSSSSSESGEESDS